MAISPVSDLIVDVARAADPQKASAASRALGAGAAPAEFSTALKQSAPPLAAGSYAYRAPAHTISPAMTPARKAEIGLESVLLKTMIDELLPKDAADIYGSGVAGDVWRSMLSEKIANEVAKSGSLHIADRLFATHQDLLQPSTLNKIQPAAPLIETRIKI
jgi:peptidoglycan hydrolase FlgJ